HGRVQRVGRAEVAEHAVVGEGQLVPEVEGRARVRPGASETDLDRRLVVRVRQVVQTDGVIRRGGPAVDTEVHAGAAQARAGARGRARAGARSWSRALAQSQCRAVGVGVAADVRVPGAGASAEADARRGAELARHLAAGALAGAILVAAARTAGNAAAHAAAWSAGVTAAVGRGTRGDADVGVQVPVVGQCRARVLAEEASCRGRTGSGVARVVVLAVQTGLVRDERVRPVGVPGGVGAVLARLEGEVLRGRGRWRRRAVHVDVEIEREVLRYCGPFDRHFRAVGKDRRAR